MTDFIALGFYACLALTLFCGLSLVALKFNRNRKGV